MEPVDVLNLNQSTNQTTGQQTTQSDKDMFLRLLVAQMTHQDPLSPMEGTEFSAQLAQFSSLEQLQNMSNMLENSIESDLLLARSINNTLAATIVGKSIRAISDQVHYNGNDPVDITFELSDRAATVTVDILDENGHVINTISGSDFEAGDGSVSWDGTYQDGGDAPSGLYYAQVSANSPDGSEVEAQSLAIGRVNGIRFVDGNPMILLGERVIPFGYVLEILESEPGGPNSSSNLLSRMLRIVR